MNDWYQRMVATLQLNGKGERTQQAYTRSVRMLSQFYDKTPDLISEPELQEYFLHRKNVNRWSPKTMRICYCGIRFFYVKVLERNWHILSILRAQKDRIGRKFSASVALPAYGQWDIGTHIPLDDPDEFVDQMALFVSRVDGITHAVRALQNAGCVPILSIGCTLTEDGFRLTWVERNENAPYEWDFDGKGNTIAPRRHRT